LKVIFGGTCALKHSKQKTIYPKIDISTTMRKAKNFRKFSSEEIEKMQEAAKDWALLIDWNVA
jgi:hypothetical protein